MIDAEQQRVNQGTDTAILVHDLSSLPRFIDHDRETVRGTSSDGMSYAGTVVRGVGPSTRLRLSNYLFNNERISKVGWVFHPLSVTALAGPIQV